MKTMQSLKVLTIAAAMANAGHVYAQSPVGEATSVPLSSSNTNTKATATVTVTAKSARAANRMLARNVRRALSKPPGLDASNIAVRANAGVVTLVGGVSSQDQINAAGDAAKGVAGVISVRNRLSIRPPQ